VSALPRPDRRTRRLASRLIAIAGAALLLPLLLDTDLAWYLWLGPLVERIPPGPAPLGVGAALGMVLASVLLRRQRGAARSLGLAARAGVDAADLVLGALGASLLLLHLPLGPFGPGLQALVGVLLVLGAARLVLGVAEARGPLSRGARWARDALPLLAVLGFATTYLALRSLAGLDRDRGDLADYALGLLIVSGFLAWRGLRARHEAAPRPTASPARRHVQVVQPLPDPQHAEVEDVVEAWVERGEGAQRYEAVVLASLRAAQGREDAVRAALGAPAPEKRKREPEAERAQRLQAHQRIVELIAGPRSN
jgi:hypothetical protein